MSSGAKDWGAAADEQEKTLVSKVGGLQVNGGQGRDQGRGQGDAAGAAGASAEDRKEGDRPLSLAEQSLLRKVGFGGGMGLADTATIITVWVCVLTGAPHEPGGESERAGDPAQGPEVAPVLREVLRRSQPEAPAAEGRLRDGLQRALQDPGDGSADPAGRPAAEHDRSVAVRHRQDRRLRPRHAEQGGRVSEPSSGKHANVHYSMS